MTDPKPEAVEALARALHAWNTSGNPYFVIHGRLSGYEEPGEDVDPYLPIVNAILADPGPLLEALTEAGVLEVQWFAKTSTGGGQVCQTRDEAEQVRARWNADLGLRIDEPPKVPIVAIERRYVSRWEPTDA